MGFHRCEVPRHIIITTLTVYPGRYAICDVCKNKVATICLKLVYLRVIGDYWGLCIVPCLENWWHLKILHCFLLDVFLSLPIKTHSKSNIIWRYYEIFNNNSRVRTNLNSSKLS